MAIHGSAVPGSGKPVEEQIDVAARRAKAVALKAEGKTWAQITEALGYSAPREAFQDVQRALAKAQKDLALKVAEYRELECAKLDDMERHVRVVLNEYDVKLTELDALIDAAVGAGDDAALARLDRREKRVTDQRLAAIDRLTRIAERRSKLLGLDQATKVEVSGQVLYAIEGVDMGDLT